MAERVIILHEGCLAERERRLGRILDFFGVPWSFVNSSNLRSSSDDYQECTAFGEVRAISAALRAAPSNSSTARRFASVYTYLGDDRQADEVALRSLPYLKDVSLRPAPREVVPAAVIRHSSISGPMSGLQVDLQLGEGDCLLSGVTPAEDAECLPILRAAGFPVFLKLRVQGTDVFVCSSSRMIDLDAPMDSKFYDVKDHFCAAVPLVLFVRSRFPEAAWHAQELGACLIIDDPLLKSRYGFCDFPKLQSLMKGHGFSTNISFIPWNWRRTSSSAAEFFKSQSEYFSVSIHGCDHTNREFGADAPEALDARARLALSRMQNHEARTGIHHEPVMVFPQGVFSSQCPEVLKRNGFLAAVNTETQPVDSQIPRTQLRDVWDVAITRYGGFPVFTRRYAFHGLENFAFDLLLGKPCLIVSHHDFFKDGGTGLIGLIEGLHSLNCRLRWSSLGEVVRRACRRRATSANSEEILMYGTELSVENRSDRLLHVKLRKREPRRDAIAQVLLDGKPVVWTVDGDAIVFDASMAAGSQAQFKVLYNNQHNSAAMPTSLRYRASVALRRILSEVRDDYLSRSRLLTDSIFKLRGMLR